MRSKNDLEDRLFGFSIEVIKLLRKIENTVEIKVIKNQLTKSATSVGANYEEAQAASSKQDFRNKIKISLKEIRETNYWLRIIKELKIGDRVEVEKLEKESEELKKILGSIAVKVSE